ncbi:MAG: TRAP transporter small permease subunit [Alphaproteobacteria bacterium]|nr:TRAP transporter small permease subunit [Alphaproteobacteria bacterium]
MERFLAAASALSLGLVFGIVFINSLRRYTLGKSFEWGEELPIYLAAYGVMFGLGLAYLQDRHIRFTILTDLLPDSVRKAVLLVGDVAVAAVGGMLVWSGIAFSERRGGVDASGLIGNAKALSESMGAEWIVWFGRMGTYQASIAVGGGILLAAAFVRLATRVAEKP